jgi:hypothetical protein
MPISNRGINKHTGQQPHRLPGRRGRRAAGRRARRSGWPPRPAPRAAAAPPACCAPWGPPPPAAGSAPGPKGCTRILRTAGVVCVSLCSEQQCMLMHIMGVGGKRLVPGVAAPPTATKTVLPGETAMSGEMRPRKMETRHPKRHCLRKSTVAEATSAVNCRHHCLSSAQPVAAPSTTPQDAMRFMPHSNLVQTAGSVASG